MSVLKNWIHRCSALRRYVGPRRLLLLVGLALCMLLAWHYYRAGALNPVMLEKYRDQHPALSVVLFVLIYSVSAVTALPTFPLNLAAGFFWGGLWGGIYSSAGATVGGLISFLLARHLVGQPLARRFDNRWVSKVQAEFESKGWKYVAFARINPIIPGAPLSYLLGLTSLSPTTFVLTTFAFLLPPAIAMALVGSAVEGMVFLSMDGPQLISNILLISGAVTFIIALKFGFAIFKNRDVR
jgi:uncharacterized membrane protein YdjX (TVP38/TMEM64 family)